MVSDDSMPPQPKTIELEKVVVPPPAESTSSAPDKLSVEDKIDRIEQSVAELSTNMNVFVDELRSTNKRLADAEEWRARFESRVSTHSHRASAIVDTTHKADLEIAAKLAQEVAARESVARKLEDAVQKIEAIGASNVLQDKKIDTILAIGTRLDKIADKPIVKTFAAMVVFTLLQIVANRYGVHLPLPQTGVP